MTEKLRQWFRVHQRDLPWRRDRSPYAVWVSEVMLQQTQVAVVEPYFIRWMEHFPTVQALAEAPIEPVLKLWEGLGYYSRARNLHSGAQYVMEKHAGIVPSEEEALRKIKGLGDYTIGAIRAFAFHKRAPALDGNVCRVLTRLFNIQGDICKTGTKRALREKLLEWLPETAPWEISEALIELGARVCTKRPSCFSCPLQKECEAHALGIQGRLPVKHARTIYTTLHRAVAVIQCENHLLLKQGSRGKVMADLYEFPYFDLEAAALDAKTIEQMVIREMQMKARALHALDEERHSFTRYRARLFPWVLEIASFRPIEGFQWIAIECVSQLPFSAGHRRILQQYQEY